MSRKQRQLAHDQWDAFRAEDDKGGRCKSCDGIGDCESIPMFIPFYTSITGTSDVFPLCTRCANSAGAHHHAAKQMGERFLTWLQLPDPA